MAEEIAKMDRSTLIKWAIVVVFSLVFIFIPEQGFYTYNVKMFMCTTVFALGLVAFDLVGELVVGILLPSMYVVLNVAPVATVFSLPIA